MFKYGNHLHCFCIPEVLEHPDSDRHLGLGPCGPLIDKVLKVVATGNTQEAFALSF